MKVEKNQRDSGYFSADVHDFTIPWQGSQPEVPRPAPKGKFVEMNEEIPGFDWAGLLVKGINVLYFLWVSFFF